MGVTARTAITAEAYRSSWIRALARQAHGPCEADAQARVRWTQGARGARALAQLRDVAREAIVAGWLSVRLSETVG